MSEEEKPSIQNIQSSDSNVLGSISAGGDISGNIHVGNVGYSSKEVSELLAQISSTFQAKPFDGTCPYKGLDYFEEADADLFFGRERLVNELVRRVKDSRTVFITGPSGSGKSSLVQAGLIHALKQGSIKGSENWLFASMKPGREPIHTLARSMAGLVMSTNAEDEIRTKARSDATIFARWCEIALKDARNKRIVLFIDQFEEVFTQVSQEEERIAFLNLLTHAATLESGRVILLFAMRSDFVPNCAVYPELNAAVNRQFIQIGSMQPEELVSAIAQPALRVGLKIEPELIAQIINDMKGEPGALPLMSFALKDLFDKEQAKGGMIALTLNGYFENKGINEALQRHADAALAQLSEHEKQLAQSIFSNLIVIGRGTQDTKRTALFNELVPADAKPNEVKAVVQKLADARLVTTEEGSDKYTITHEKLIDAWPWLKKLINENRDAITLQNEIASAAKEWEENKRDASYLYSGGRLANIWEQVQKQKLALGQLAQEFVKAGRRRQQRTRAALISAVSLVLIAAIVASVVFQNQARTNIEIAQAAETARAQAEANALEAQKQTKIALTRQLAAQAQSLFATGYSKQIPAVLLAIQSMRLIPSFETAQILQTNSLPHQIASITYGNTMNSIAFSGDGKYVVSGGCDKADSSNNCFQGSARVWEVATGNEVAHMIHDGEVWSVAFSPDGKYVISGSADKTARVWEAGTGKEIARMTHDSAVNSVAFSSDGKHVVSGGCDQQDTICIQGSVRVWETTTGKETSSILHTRDIGLFLAFNSNGKYVVSGAGYTASVWEAATGKEIANMTHDNWVVSVAFSPDGRYVVSGSWDGTARVWEASTGKEIIRATYGDVVSSVAFSPDGKYVAVTNFTYVRVWEISTGKEVAFMTHDSRVTSVAFSPDGKYVVSGSNDKTARVWEAGTGKEIARMTHDGEVWSVAFSSDGKYVVSRDGTIAIVWEPNIRNEIARMTHDSYVSSVAFSPDGKFVISISTDIARVSETSTGKEIFLISYDGGVAFSPDGKYVVSISGNTAHIWMTSTGIEVAHMTHEGGVSSVAFSPDSKYVVSGSWDGTARVWEAATGQEVARMTHNNPVESIAFSPDSNYVVSTSVDGTVLVWEATTGKELARMTGSSMNSIAFSPNGKYVISRSRDNTIRIWEINTGKETTRIADDSATFVAFSSNGKYLVLRECNTDGISLCAQSFVSVWDVGTGKEISHMTHDGEVWSVAVSPDGKYLVSGSSDNTARVWEISTGKEISRMTHDGWVWSVAFSPDGKFVISGGCDKQDGIFCAQAGSARVWEAATGNEIARMTLDSSVYFVTFSPDGKYVVSSSGDDTVRVWIYRPEDLIAENCSRVTRNLTLAEWDQYIGDALPYQAVCENLPIEEEITSTTTP